ncbi:MAG: hypothetical protein KME42_17370 [Tildeniella nuda ZEHNDER 1965/U140]|nr:hypothetical protein [Tildeniella nuda ZEHNDER 1965/U140]
MRDPFTLNRIATGQMLRRESRPLARIQRDFKSVVPSMMWMALGSAIFVGTAVFLIQNVPIKHKTLPQPTSTPIEVKRSP